MKLKESQLRNFIRNQIKEMAYAGRLSPQQAYIYPSWVQNIDDEEELDMYKNFANLSDTSLAFNYDRENPPNPDIPKKYAMSQTFERLAKKHFANIPWNVWFAPLIGTYREIVTDSNEETRATLEPLYPDGIARLKKIGYEIPENIGTDDVVILYTTTIMEKNFIATPWMIVHSMFDNNNTGVFSKTYKEKLGVLMGRGRQSVPPPKGTEALIEEEYMAGVNKWKNALTMRSARIDDIAVIEDAFAEIMCQELLTKSGFTINDSGAEQKYIDALYALKPVIKQCAREFNSNIRGKLIITAVN